MIKISSLRTAIHAALPECAADPDRLSVFVDKGRLVARLGAQLGYEYRYDCTLWLPGFTGGPDRLMVPLLLWLRENQPDLFQRFDRDDQAIEFAADILDADAADILIRFELTEGVRLTPRPDGSGWDVDRTIEPTMAEIEIAAGHGMPALGELVLNDRNAT